jgi:DNA repair exonuclease SbcCD ATPase subunit
LEETERLAKEAIAAFQKANKSAQDYAKVVKSSADEFAKGLPKVSEHDKRLEEHKNSLKQARPELDGQVKTTLAQLNKDWQAAKTDDDKDAVVKKAETAIETYMGKVRPPHSAVNQTHAGVSAAADDARKQVASMRQTTTAGYDSVRKSYADFQVKLMALAAAAGKIDPQGGQKTATPDANLATLKRQASELVRTLAEHYKSLAGEIPPIVSADAKLNDAGDAMEKIYAK